MPVLVWVLGLLVVAGMAFHVACLLCTLRFKRSALSHSLPEPEPGVSVLVPIRGIDEAATANWSSFCEQDYPQCEVLFGVMDAEDEAIPLIQSIVSRFPEIARLVLCPEVRGINHQISNLMQLVEAATHEIVIFADSDVRVTPCYARTVTAPLAKPSTGVVTCGYLDHNPHYLGAALAALGRGVDFLPSVLLAQWLDGGLKFALGPTIATRKSVLAAFGGLQTVVNRIGSDFHIGHMAHAAHYKVELSPYILDNDCGRESVKVVFQRELRWARTIRLNRGPQYYGMVFTHGPLYSLVLLGLAGFTPWTVSLALAAWGLRGLQATLTMRAFNCPCLLRWLWALPVRDSLSFVIWLLGCTGRRVYWRGRWLAIAPQGILTEL